MVVVKDKLCLLKVDRARAKASIMVAGTFIVIVEEEVSIAFVFQSLK